MKRVVAAAAILLATGGASLLAHHPFAVEYDWKRPVTVTGTVTKLEWKNPHATVMMKGKDDSGAEAEWTIELGSPAQLQKVGWKAQQLHSGEQVTIDGWLARDGSKRVSAKSVKVSGGRELFAASSFFDEATAASGKTHPRETAPTTGKR